jgi:photosystem II stability/assembly factor-like uncharacterized protein
VVALFTAAGGDLLARTETALFRSGDAGVTWSAVFLPPQARLLAVVDASDHSLLYAAAGGALYRQRDDEACWQRLAPRLGYGQRLAVSPADPNLLYAASATSSAFSLARSRDGGATWEMLSQRSGELCTWNVDILQPHPSDVQRVFLTTGCYAGRNISSGNALLVSADQGATFSRAFHPGASSFPARLVGGRGAAPQRFYLAANKREWPHQSWVYRSDDDGASWAQALAVQTSGSGPGPAGLGMSALTYAPAAPDHVYVGLTGYRGSVRASVDGGATWSALGRRDPGDVHDLALSADGRRLATASGSAGHGEVKVWDATLWEPKVRGR